MTFIKRIDVDDLGDATHVGTSHWDWLDKYHDDIDTTSFTGKAAKINTPTEFRSGILKIKGSDNAFAYTLKGSAIAANYDLTLPSIAGNATLMAAGGANDFGTSMQTFRSSNLALRNPANSASYLFVASAIVADRNVTIPLLTGNDEMVMKAFAQTLTNKTLEINNNTIKHSTTNAQGDILKYDSTSGKYIRIARGSASQVLAVNSGGTDIEWATVSAGSGGDADEVKVYEGGTQVGTVARKLNFDTTDFNVTESSGANTFTVSLASAATASNVNVYDRNLSTVDVVSSASKTTIYTFTVTGNDLSTNKILEIDIGGDYLNDTGSSRAMDVFVDFGSTTLWTDTMGSFSNASTRRAFTMKLFLANKNSASAQELWGEIKFSKTPAPTTGIGSGDDGDAGLSHPIASVSGGSTENTTTNKTFTVSVQHSSSNSSISLRKRAAVTKIM